MGSDLCAIVIRIGNKRGLPVYDVYFREFKNCVYATLVAKAKGITVIALTGVGVGKLGKICDCMIAVPEMETYKAQELHVPVYHCLCAMLEKEFF